MQRDGEYKFKLKAQANKTDVKDPTQLDGFQKE